jgi:hypothetical protein
MTIRYPASPPKFFAHEKNFQHAKFAGKIGAGNLPYGKLSRLIYRNPENRRRDDLARL